jgi:hypothetical protein
MPITSSAHPHQLGIPDEPLRDPLAHELVRIWSTGSAQFFALNVAPEEDPAAWGIFALDLMRHAARAYQHHDGRPKEDAYRRILAGFAAEMQSPTETL